MYADIDKLSSQLTAWRRELHRYPETAFEEIRTSRFVSERLQEFGMEVHTGLAKTGVVGVLKAGSADRLVGLRADMDALHVDEKNEFEHRSRVPGKMHACGHDGHTTMLLGAARYLAKTRNFDGTVVFIFQPAEENKGGGRVMVEQGLFEQFPVSAVFGMHNMPGIETGKLAIRPGAMLAGFATFECEIEGVGTHSSMPQTGIDPISLGARVTTAWESITVKMLDPHEPALISTTQFNAGETYNVIPQKAMLKGSTRFFSKDTGAILGKKMQEITDGICAGQGARYSFNYKILYPPLINNDKQTEFARSVAVRLVGEANTIELRRPLLGSEDFAYMLEVCPGAYILIGNGVGPKGGCMCHNPEYDFNDEILTLGTKYWVSLAENYLRI